MQKYIRSIIDPIIKDVEKITDWEILEEILDSESGENDYISEVIKRTKEECLSVILKHRNKLTNAETI